MTDAAGMVAVHVGHDHPAHIERIEAQRLELGANLFFRLDPAAPATLQDGMPPGLIAGIVCMRAFSGIDNDQALDRCRGGSRDAEPQQWPLPLF